MSASPAPSTTTASNPSTSTGFNWVGFVVSIFAAAAIAMVIGLPAYHFLADQPWGEAASSSLRWAGLAMLGVALGHAFSAMFGSRAKGGR